MMQVATVDDLAEVIRSAQGPLRIQGGGTRPVGNPVVGSPLQVGLRGITLYEPGALTLVAQAGTPLAEIDAVLADHAQHLPFEPMDHRALMGTGGEPTLGGMVAANASGPRRLRAGACRDSLIGVQFVDGTGTAIRNGGRVMKNVTGYDLARLMAGSHGTLGVLTEVAFKLLPRPEKVTTLILPGLDAPTAVAAMAAALRTPFEVTGAGWAGGNVMLRIEGFATSVADRAERLAAALARFGRAELAAADPWPALRDVTGFAGREGDVWRLSVAPTDAAQVAGRIEGEVILDWGGGLIWALVPPGTDLRGQLGSIRGHATLVRAAPETRAALGAFHPEPQPVAAIAAGLRARFDPRGILNPGLMA